MSADATAAQSADPAPTFRLWKKIQELPLGNWLFSQAVCFKAPYFRTVRPLIRELRPGLCRVTAPNRRGMRNHLGTYHAIASCNMAEIAGGMLTEATVPATHRWIPAGMTVEYNATATTAVTAIARLEEIPEFGAEKFDIIVPVDVLDADGTAFVTARITMHISPKRR
ncbi:hotdog fold domain-containing protein [Brevibacterium sp. CFH 10365]|uniref:hotdog fold domain-containing protein n=1 Tax=Brevibacterium sp. CFH 10365 TaxID=2585207 RepID=UPI0012666F11|nr:hotdog fold domain-containing protein [Brevibacterium sp. CFH 10365]